MEFPKQEYWSGLPFPSPGDLPDPGIEPASPALQADSLPTELGQKPLNTVLHLNRVECLVCCNRIARTIAHTGLPWWLGGKESAC